MWQDFRKFVMRGSVVDLAVGVIIGAAFGAIVSSFVQDLLMPPIGLAIGDVNFTDLFVVLRDGATAAGPYATLAEAKDAGAVTFNYGNFLTLVINFLIIAVAVFLVIRMVERLHRKDEAPAATPTTKDCPYCVSPVALAATRCPHCTSQLGTPA